MNAIQFAVDASRCTACGACVKDCPGGVLEQEAGKAPQVRAGGEEMCIACQHCLAVCPTAAVSVFGRDPANSLPLTCESLPAFDAVDRLVRGRRSVRQYQPQNVGPALIDRLLRAAAHAPTGCNFRSLTFALIDDRAELDRLREKLLAALTEAKAAGRLEQTPDFLWEAVVAWRERGEDHIFRGAPHVLLVFSKPEAVCKSEDAIIALSNFDLLAQSAGVGTVWCGYLRFILDTLPELRPLFGIPDGGDFYPILFGYPAVRYARTVQRDADAAIRRVRV